MTRKLTREERVQSLYDLKIWQVLNQGDIENIKMLARMALAAMDSEPVAFINGAWTLVYYRPPKESGLKIGDKLYRHAQQLLVPDDVLDALQKVARIRLDLNDFDGDRRGIADCLGDAEDALIEVVNRRAAMLAAAPQSPGSEPATMPGKWIPVSERMPEAEGHYLVWANASRIDGYCDHLAIATYQGGEWSNEFNWLVTHWMPLPVGPQEVKGE
ncbi:TPA: DUF551 domain-containing protein [Klebsiella oxytoca]